MTTTSSRYFQLLAQIEKNPLRPKVAGAFDVASDFAMDMQRIEADRRLSREGRRDAADGLVRKAIRDMRDVAKPLNEHRAKTEEMRGKVKRPAYDRADLVGPLARRELRDAARGMTSGQRAGHMAGPTRSVAFVDALSLRPTLGSLASTSITRTNFRFSKRQNHKGCAISLVRCLTRSPSAKTPSARFAI